MAKSNDVLEVSIEDQFVKYAKRFKCVALKLVFFGKRGFPDRSVLAPGGIIFFIEFKKSSDKRLSATQYPVRVMLEKFGFKYYVCNKKGQAESILDKHLNKKEQVK